MCGIARIALYWLKNMSSGNVLRKYTIYDVCVRSFSISAIRNFEGGSTLSSQELICLKQIPPLPVEAN